MLLEEYMISDTVVRTAASDSIPLLRQERQPPRRTHRGVMFLLLVLMLPATAQKFGIEPDELHEPAANIEAGVRYLNWLRKRYSNDLDLVLAAYHAGIGEVDRHGGLPPDPAVQSYVRQIHEILELEH